MRDRVGKLGVAHAVFVAWLAVLALGWLHWVDPFLSQPRSYVAGTPSPPAFAAIYGIPLKPGGSDCEGDVTIESDASAALFVAGTYSHPGIPIALVLDGPGYHATAHTPPGYPDNAAQAVPFRSPTRALIGTVCFRNDGRTPVLLNGTNEPRTRSRPLLTVDGRPLNANIALSFASRRAESYRRHLPTIVAHASTFRPLYMRGAMLWALMALVIVGLPVGVVASLQLSLRERAERAGDKGHS